MSSLPYVLISLLIPNTITVFGSILKNHPPAYRNQLFGYRSIRSMQNKKNWEMAQKLAGTLWWKMGWIDLVICLIVQFLLTLTHNALVIIYGTFALMVLQLVPLIVTFVLVERKLKQNDS